MPDNRRRRVRFLLLGLLLLAMLFGAMGVRGARRTLAEVTVRSVTQSSDPDEVLIDVRVKLRGTSTGSWVRNDQGVVKVSPAFQTLPDGVSLLDWFLRPEQITLGQIVCFELEPGEDLKVHVSPPVSRWVRSDEDLVLVSSSRDGVVVRSIALRFEPTAQ